MFLTVTLLSPMKTSYARIEKDFGSSDLEQKVG